MASAAKHIAIIILGCFWVNSRVYIATRKPAVVFVSRTSGSFANWLTPAEVPDRVSSFYKPMKLIYSKWIHTGS